MKIKVVNQRLYLEPPETAEGTREYLRAEFSFSEEWEGTVKTAFFRGADGNTYTQLLENDYWLRNVASERMYTLVSQYGDASSDMATSTYGIRPVFAIG